MLINLIYNKPISKFFFIFVLAIVSIECRKIGYRQDYQILDLRRMNNKEKLNVLMYFLLPRRRSIDVNSMAVDTLYEILARKLLRHQDESPPVAQEETEVSVIKDNQQAGVIEHELHASLSQKKSALQERPFVQHKGRNDFLVLQAGIKDPYVTVVPNDIYYSVEKKCVNWLDDCNIRGLRQRLLQRVQSPYR